MKRKWKPQRQDPLIKNDWQIFDQFILKTLLVHERKAWWIFSSTRTIWNQEMVLEKLQLGGYVKDYKANLKGKVTEVRMLKEITTEELEILCLGVEKRNKMLDQQRKGLL